MTSSDDELIRRMHHELIDSYDEELELELEEQALDALTGTGSCVRTEEHRVGASVVWALRPLPVT